MIVALSAPSHMGPPAPPSRGRRRPRLPGWARLSLLAAILVASHLYAADLLAMLKVDASRGVLSPPVLLLLVGYVLLLAVPFMPGVEVGLVLLAAFGAAAAPAVWLATVLGLALAYAIGRTVPLPRVAAFLDVLAMRGTAAALREADASGPGARSALIERALPRKLSTVVLRHRYLTLAVLLNLPGNALIGGGGGIAGLSGLCRLHRPAPFVLTVALAVAPVPAFVMVLGRLPF